MEIEIIHQPDEAQLQAHNVQDWPIWEKEVSSFPWHYDATELCYLLEGEVTVTPKQGEPVIIKAGDFVRFPKGLSCHWDIHQAVRKHYQFTE